MSFRISWRADHTHTNLRDIEYSHFAEFCSHIEKSQSKTIPDVPAEGASKEEKNAYKQAKINNAYFLRGCMPGGVRKGNENMQFAELLILDCDSKSQINISPQDAHDALVKHNITHYIYTSVSHTDERPSFRVIVPHKTNAGECERATRYLANLIPDILVDSASWRWIQEWYLSKVGCWSEYHDGDDLVIPDDWMPDYTHSSTGGDTTTAQGTSYDECLQALFRGEDAHPNYYRMAQAMLARGGTPESVFRELEPIVRTAFAINNREYEDWRPQRIKDAIDDGWKKDQAKLQVVDIGDKKDVNAPPHFDTSFVTEWPKPWPMIFRNFENCIYHVIPEICVPACFAFHGVLLNGIFRTVRGRGVNLNIQIVTASGVGKDSNTSAPIAIINKMLASKLGDTDKGSLMRNLGSLVTNSVTSDTTYLSTIQSDNHMYGGLVLNTEASGHWDMVANAENAHTEGVMRIEINMWDGDLITGKAVRGHTYNSITRPNYSVLRLQQTEALADNLTPRMVDIGLANRIDYYADNVDRPEIASTSLNKKSVGADSDYMDLMEGLATIVNSKKNQLIRVECGLPGGDISKFENEILLPLVNNKIVTRDEYKYLKRIVGSAEKQVTAICAYNYLWKVVEGIDTTDMVIGGIGDLDIVLDGTPFEKYVIPLMKYQLQMRRYLYRTILNESQFGAETNAIDEVFVNCKKSKSKEYLGWLKQGHVPYAFFYQRVTMHKFFKAKSKDYNSERMKRIVTNWMDTNGFKKDKVMLDNGRTKECIVMR